MILASLKPYYYYLIAEEKKTIEVRKSRLKNLPQDIVFYMSKDEKSFAKIPKEYQEKYRRHFGKVGLKFVCDEVICSQAYFDSQGKKHLTNVFPEDIKKTCLTEYDLWDYIAVKACKANETYSGYLWHISDLKIYDKPKELSEFWTVKCTNKRNSCIGCEVKPNCIKTITRPPQSWCYIEEL